MASERRERDAAVLRCVERGIGGLRVGVVETLGKVGLHLCLRQRPPVHAQHEDVSRPRVHATRIRPTVAVGAEREHVRGAEEVREVDIAGIKTADLRPDGGAQVEARARRFGVERHHAVDVDAEAARAGGAPSADGVAHGDNNLLVILAWVDDPAGRGVAKGVAPLRS